MLVYNKPPVFVHKYNIWTLGRSLSAKRWTSELKPAGPHGNKPRRWRVLGPLFAFQRCTVCSPSASDWSFHVEGVPVASTERELTDGCKLDFSVFRLLSALIAFLLILYSGWPAPCGWRKKRKSKHKHLIPQSWIQTKWELSLSGSWRYKTASRRNFRGGRKKTPQNIVSA